MLFDGWFRCVRCGRSADPSLCINCPKCWAKTGCPCRDGGAGTHIGKRRAVPHTERDRLAEAFYIPGSFFDCGCWKPEELRRAEKRQAGQLGTILGEVKRTKPKSWVGKCARGAASFDRYDAARHLESRIRDRIEEMTRKKGM